MGVAAVVVLVLAKESSNCTTPFCEVVPSCTVFLCGVITPFVSCDTESMNDSPVPSALGSVTAVCFVLKSVAFFPLSVRFPLASNAAKLPEVAPDTLSALPLISW